MADQTQEANVQNNQDESRFEVRTGDDIAFLEYDLEDGKIYFTHTEVPPAFEGKGIGKALAIAALEFARGENLEVIPRCRFVASFIKKNPEYVELVPESSRSLVA